MTEIPISAAPAPTEVQSTLYPPQYLAEEGLVAAGQLCAAKVKLEKKAPRTTMATPMPRSRVRMISGMGRPP